MSYNYNPQRKKKVPYPKDVKSNKESTGRKVVENANPSLYDMDEMTRKRLLKDLKDIPRIPKSTVEKETKSKSSSATTDSNANANSDLVTSMASRLRGLEQQLRTQKQLLIEKDHTIEVLTSEVNRLKLETRSKQLHTEGEQEQQNQDFSKTHKFREAMDENLRLRNQVREMEKFLSDYGLQWVGEGSEDEDEEEIERAGGGSRQHKKETLLAGGSGKWNWKSSIPEEKKSEESKQQVYSSMPDLKNIMKAVDELNVLAGEGCSVITKDSDGHARLREKDPIPIVFFSNGITVNRGQFRPYGWPLTQGFISDILDGYFPYEFKDQFPEGVPLRVIDRSKDSYKSFAEQSETEKKSTNVKSISSLDGESKEVKQTKEQFLEKLPKNIIRGGKVVSVRNEIEKLLSGNKGEVRQFTVPTDASKAVEEVLSEHPGMTEAEARKCASENLNSNITVLNVRYENGGQTLKLQLLYSQTIQEVRDYIDAYRSARGGNGNKGAGYELRTTFPAKVYKDPAETLEGAGLIPSANIMIRAVSS